jgi:SAM-dependent methyltransferase
VDIEVDPGNREQADAWNGSEGRNWAELADHYESSAAAWVPVIIETAAIGSGERVLDIGCGNGGSTFAAALAAPRGHVTGLDISGPLLESARRRAAERGIDNVTFEQADAQVHALEPDAFDVAISKFGAMFFADPVAAFTNITGALRHGGRLALLAWVPLAGNEWLTTLRGALAVGRDLPAPPVGLPGPFGLADPDTTRGFLTDAGLVDIALEQVDRPFVPGATVDEAMAFAGATGIVQGLLHDLDDETRAEALSKLRDALTAHLTPDGVVLGSSAWAITARRP